MAEKLSVLGLVLGQFKEFIIFTIFIIVISYKLQAKRAFSISMDVIFFIFNLTHAKAGARILFF